MGILGVLVTWLGLSIAAGCIAKNKGRSGAGSAFLALFLSPLIGLIAALAAQPNAAEIEMRQLKSSANRKCPFCAEVIKAEAKVCRQCGREVPSAATLPAIPFVGGY